MAQEHVRTFRQELIKAQEESRAIWSDNFMHKFGNPHTLVMSSKERMELEFKHANTGNISLLENTSFYRVRKKLNEFEDGERLLVIDRRTRSMRNEVPEDEETTEAAQLDR